MTDETLQGEIPAPADASDEVTDSAPVTDAAEPAPAESGTKDTDVISPVQKRFDKLTWEKGELSRRAEQAERRARELEAYMFQKNEPVKDSPKGPPTLAQFDYDEAKYQAASLEYYDARSKENAQRVVDERDQKVRQDGLVKSFREREAEFKAKTPDYSEKVYGSEFMSIPISTEVAALIASSSDGPGIAYHLSENLPLASEISRLPPLEAAREIGKIEAKLSMPKAVPPPVSKAPAPPPKVDAVEPDIKKGLDDPNLTDKEFEKIRKRQIAQRR